MDQHDIAEMAGLRSRNMTLVNC